MSHFEFLFSLYGLLLGLAITELASGFSRIYDRRKTQPIGWLGPGLAAVLICDLLTFWLAAWSFRDWQVTYLLTLGATALGLAYYFATTQVFPREGDNELADAHAMAHRRVVVTILFGVNLAVFGADIVASVVEDGFTPLAIRVIAINLVYYALLAGVFMARSVGLAALCAWTGAAYLIVVVGFAS